MDALAKLRKVNRSRQCARVTCITNLYSGNPGPFCFVHTLPHHSFETWFLDLRQEGVPPKGNLECPDCGRIRKSTTSCLCKAKPAPRWAA